MNNNTKARFKSSTKQQRIQSAKLGLPLKNKWNGKPKVAASGRK